jgi:hypothetical protein
MFFGHEAVDDIGVDTARLRCPRGSRAGARRGGGAVEACRWPGRWRRCRQVTPVRTCKKISEHPRRNPLLMSAVRGAPRIPEDPRIGILRLTPVFSLL